MLFETENKWFDTVFLIVSFLPILKTPYTIPPLHLPPILPGIKNEKVKVKTCKRFLKRGKKKKKRKKKKKKEEKEKKREKNAVKEIERKS